MKCEVHDAIYIYVVTYTIVHIINFCIENRFFLSFIRILHALNVLLNLLKAKHKTSVIYFAEQ